jgi:tRNA nucleotidyltransferase (CCA-adding enzyme)
LKIIVSHTNADFDALAGMVAVSKLYPDASLLFPGSIEKNLRDFIEKNREKLPSIISGKEIDKRKIEEIILVDVGSTKRLGTFANLVEGKKVIVFDHHPGAIDVECEESVDEECGSVTSILTEILEKKGIEVTPFEATLFLLGIYEDTGFLTFPTTREKDYDSAKRCLKWGGQLTEISRWLNRRLTETQLRILTKLVENLESIVIGGVRIHITTLVSTEFHPDLSLLLHEILNSEDIDAIFLVAFLESRVHIIARSRNPMVNVGEILEKFGGGGHASAGSAAIKNATLNETKRKLVDILYFQSNIGYKAGELCKRDFAKGSINFTIKDSLLEMNKYRINSLPIFDGNKVIGVVTRQEIDKAVQLKMEDHPATTLVISKPPIFFMDDSIEKVYREMVERNYYLVFVGNSEEEITGIISRGDLQKKLSEKYSGLISRSQGGVPSIDEMRRILEGYFTKEEMKELKEVGKTANEMGMSIYLVGGVVRDILLHKRIKDLDFVVEGEAPLLAQKWRELKGGRIKTHSEFQTAIWIKSDKRWDFATARVERYDFPAALPIVENSKLENDLSRRDFTINAMAISLNGEDFGQLIDPFGGIRDLRQSKIKVLHSVSIFDDPTRAFRAVRFSASLNFSISPETKQLIQNALKQDIFKKLSPKRILSEMIEILKSPSFIEALNLLEELKLLHFFWHSLSLTPKVKENLYKAQQVCHFFEGNFPEENLDRATFFLLPLIDKLSAQDLQEFIKYYPFQKKTKEILSTYRDTLWDFKKRLMTSKVNKVKILELFSSTPLILLLYYLSRCDKEDGKNLIRDYILKDRFLTLEIDGEDLKKAGLKPDRCFKDILLKTKVAKMEGLIKNREDQLEYALKVAKSLREKNEKK